MSMRLRPIFQIYVLSGFTQQKFASLPGVSLRTLQEWEQGRKNPSGAARTLLKIAGTNPKALLAVADDYRRTAVNFGKVDGWKALILFSSVDRAKSASN